MPKPTARLGRSSPLRLFSNLLVVALLILAADWLYGRWRNGPGFLCEAATGVDVESWVTGVGMFGLVIAILGICLGGVRHPMTSIGMFFTLLGLFGVTLLGTTLQSVCP